MLRRTLFLLTATVLLATGVAKATPTPAQKCVVAKQKAAVRKAKAKLQCYQRATAAGTSVNPNCLTTAEMKFTTAIGKIEATGHCAVTGDATLLENTADEFVNIVDAVGCSPAGSCGSFSACGTGGAGLCGTAADGGSVCLNAGASCPGSNCSTTADCAKGKVCVVNTCCAGNVCLPVFD